jgi:hypothetical protein
MRAYLILPQSKTIEMVNHSGDYRQIYDFLNAKAFDLVNLYENEDGAYIDDEGLIPKTHKGKRVEQYFWIHRNYPTPLAGPGLVLGHNEDGDSVEPSCTIEELRNDVKWCGDSFDVALITKFSPGRIDFRDFWFKDEEEHV